MDAFYASVEQLDFPALRGKAIAVGGAEPRGVVATASYEARKFGVRSAISGVQARKLCPHLIFVKPRFDRYKQLSMQIRAIFYEYTDLVEPLSGRSLFRCNREQERKPFGNAYRSRNTPTHFLGNRAYCLGRYLGE